ncbi:hypothetical protein B5X24_HaOG209989 [Helicoverpa armigera]|uniref:Uncharacterized protein n=1 Tax=Helicoverpa armigera TaxID=29058 RepID=A0A2W1BFT5_HELAM|nr:hypothetical protein B5X24_HaOG209989 [Helicoverpa armigera]
MASRLLFEEDISENNGKNIGILQEPTSQSYNLDDNDQNGRTHTDSNNTEATEMINEKMADETPNNHDVDHNTVDVSNVIQENSTNNTTADTVEKSNGDKVSELLAEQNGITSGSEGVKQKPKKKPSELELLGVDTKTIAEWDAQFDVFGADSQIYRKYKLRKVDQQ